MTENKGEKLFRASCSFSTALQPLWRHGMLPDTGFGSVTAVMTNCSASQHDKHVVGWYESAQKAKLWEQHWNQSLWSEGWAILYRT